METKKGYIYAIAHPLTKEVVYIGQTLNIKKRSATHIAACKNTNLKKWINELKKQCHLPLFIEVAQCEIADLLNKETEIIDEYRKNGSNLFNSSPGAVYRVGRPNENKTLGETAKGYQVSLTPNDNNDIIKLYGSRSRALKILLLPEVIKALKSFIK